MTKIENERVINVAGQRPHDHKIRLGVDFTLAIADHPDGRVLLVGIVDEAGIEVNIPMKKDAVFTIVKMILEKALSLDETPKKPDPSMKTDIRAFPDSFVVQWGPVVNQFEAGRTLKENLLAHKYPTTDLNLTKDQTKDWDIDRPKMRLRHRIYRSDVERLRWSIPQPDGVYLFSIRMAVCPDDTILWFD